MKRSWPLQGNVPTFSRSDSEKHQNPQARYMAPRHGFEPDNSRIKCIAAVTYSCGSSPLFSRSEKVKRDSAKGSDKAGSLSDRQRTTTPPLSSSLLMRRVRLSTTCCVIDDCTTLNHSAALFISSFNDSSTSAHLLTPAHSDTLSFT